MPLKILSIHNTYLIRGGEDGSFAAKNKLLKDKGHHVVIHTESNTRIEQLGKIRTAAKTIWSKETSKYFKKLLTEQRIDLIECENTFPLISPSIYYVANEMGVPVIQNIRNYRLLCPNALFFREGRVCEDCMGKFVPWPGVKNKCYKESLAGSATIAAMLTTHRALGTWRDKVDMYVALTEFARDKLIQGGIPSDRIAVKPNFVPDPGEGSGEGDYVLYVGRLSPEKGIDTLLAAWKLLKNPIRLKIAGDGPLTELALQAAETNPNIEYVGSKSIEEVYDVMGEARLLVFPSVWYEGLPRTIIEAYAKGTPVVASKLGAMESIVRDGVTGSYFEPGNASDLAMKLDALLSDEEKLRRMRTNARKEFENKYTAERHYDLLMNIYDRVLTHYPKKLKKSQ